MRRSKSLAKIRAGQPVKMCALGHFVPAYVRHAAHFGYDCIWLDLEHRTMDDRELQSLLAHFHLFDIDCLLRVTTREKAKLYRYLEDGATGLMIPHVSNATEAVDLVNSIKFPPLGDRGIDGAGLDSDYLLADIEAFRLHANEETFLVVQIESPRAVQNVDEIAAVEGVDGLFVGTGDLAMRIRANADSATVGGALKKVADAAQRYRKVWGCPAGSVEHLRELHQHGARLINFGSEYLAFSKMLENSSRELTDVFEA